MIILPSPANSQREFAPNSQYCEFQAEFAANSRCERIRSEFGEFKLNSLRICIPTAHMGAKTKSAHLLRWHYGKRVILRQFSNSFPKTFQLSL